MKKRKRLNLLKLGVFLLGFSLLLWNCEKDIETIEPKQETLEVTKPPVIQTLSLNELREDSKFNELKKSYEILQNTTQAKRTEDN
ncbi:hypothetical protein VBY74_09410, partial [Tenacibaculum ascidiaceicola]|uniref:hypothetical protein n=1 Tax=Tenacibaculum ascidiaceicola TaxID=1699411 RepID=UPI0039E81B78